MPELKSSTHIACAALALALFLALLLLATGQAQDAAQPAPLPFGHTRPAPTDNAPAFTAVGDGQANDTAALQAWIDAARESGGRLHIPAGAYRLTKSLVVSLAATGPLSIRGDGTARLVMEGPGPALQIVGTHGGTAAPRTIQPHVWAQERMPLVDGIEVVGAHPEACGIELVGSMQATLTRVTVRDALHGIHLTSRNRNVQISDCHLYHNRGVGLYLDGVNLHQINVVGCHISYNGQGGIVCRDSEVRNLQVGTCDIEANMAEDGPPAANILLDCRSGSVREVAIVGCTIQHTADAPDSANIRCLGQSPQTADKVGNMAISDNVFSDAQWNIHLQFARGVTMTGNVFWHGQAGNLLVEHSSDVVIGPNLFDRNPDYGREDDGSTNALVFRECRDCILTGLHINNTLDAPAALTLDRCRWFNVTGCTILDCDGAGLWLDRCRQCLVSGCLVRDERPTAANPVALRVTGCEEVEVGENMLRGRVVNE
jgi:hypothetical protein